MSKRNIIFGLNVDLKGEGRWASSRVTPYEYSIRSWKSFAEKVDADLFILDEVLLPVEQMSLCWQRYFIFDILEANNIEYDQIAIVDFDTIVHPNCPNFFELTNRKFTGVHNDGSYDWVIRSLENYSKAVFNGFQSKFWNYIDCGFMIVNEKHKDFFKTITHFYSKNSTKLKEVEKLHTGTDQTPVNILIERENVELKLLPYEFNMIDLNRKEILDEQLTFTNIGHIFHFNCIPNNVGNVQTLYWMRKTYNHLYEYEICN